MKKVIIGSLVLMAALAFSRPAQVGQKKGNAPKPAVGGSWRVWGGPQRDFLTTSAGIFTAGSEKWMSNPPKKLWERPLGDGYSAIAVEDRVLYTAFRRDSNDVVTALDVNSGKTIWEFTYAAPFKNAFSEAAPGPYAMPQVIGDHVVTASGIGQIHSLDKLTGKSVWSLDLYSRFSGSRLNFGYSSHALPYKDSLIVVAGGNQYGVMKVRQNDGFVIWGKHRLENAHSSPLLIDVDGQQQVAILLAQEIVGIDPESGELLWRHPHTTEYGLAVSTPVWADGNLLFLSTAYNGGSRVLKLTRAGNKTVVRELWHNPRIQSHIGTVISRGGYVYLSSGQNVALITAVELQTGRIAWQVRDFVKAQMVYADGKMVILDQDGNLGVGLASPEKFQALAKWPILSAIAWSPPTLVGNRLYMRDRKVIMALEFGTPHR
ncbi:MAG: PQQ-like beta-propeller repeat protein [Acidobacteria bacterium]|nr:PQQ-like beta-propeller repeat protein [Acidobacteriota bacterium]